ncbi:MAG: hypothetical protein K8R36_03155 [Planctomycetales bacterium]|nr:hypothetical protein [Planctomycetales bacterium]
MPVSLSLHNDYTGTGDTAASCGGCDDGCDVGNWRDNTIGWFGGDAFKSVGDSGFPPGVGAGFMNSAGLVSGLNTGFRLGNSRVRGQVGGSYGIYDLKGRDTASPSSSEQQTFITAGIYKRSDISNGEAISWGLGFDQLFDHQYGLLASELYLTQLRGIAGYAINECYEVGVWATLHTNSDTAFGGGRVPGNIYRAQNQFNTYLRHNWDFGGSTMAYVGLIDHADTGSWVMGYLGQAPLSDTVSLYGNMTYVFPSSSTGAVGSNEHEWNVGMGLSYSFGGKAVSSTVSGNYGLPLLPVANNGSFIVGR